MMELVVVIVSTYMNIKIIAVHRSNVINPSVTNRGMLTSKRSFIRSLFLVSAPYHISMTSGVK